jgi:glutamate-1-semialdehyde 2,1-aminomutase
MFGAEDWPAYFSRCSGCEVWDLQGRRYIDFAGGIGAVLLGYADEDITGAVQRRLSSGTYCSLVNPQEVELAERLLELHPWAGKVRYARRGGEAMSMAVRIARASTGRSGIAFCGYHGWHDWYLAANLGDSHALDGHLLPGLSPKGVPRELKGTSVPFRYNDMASFEKAMEVLGDNIAAVVMEPMRSEFPKDNFLEKVAAACRSAGAVFIVDEITSGLRYGFPGALSKIGLAPDVVVYAKALSNGIPFAAIVGREAIMNGSDGSFISSSYWTDGIGPAAALAVLKKMQRLQVYDVVWGRGEKFYVALTEIASRFPACNLKVGGMPVSPTLTFDLKADAKQARTLFTTRMMNEGFLISSVIYLMYAHQENHIRDFLEALERVLRDMEDIINAGKLGEHFNGQETQNGFSRLV